MNNHETNSSIPFRPYYQLYCRRKWRRQPWTAKINRREYPLNQGEKSEIFQSDELNDLCQYVSSGASTLLGSLVFCIMAFVGIMFAV